MLWKDIKDGTKIYDTELTRLNTIAQRLKARKITFWTQQPKPSVPSSFDDNELLAAEKTAIAPNQITDES